MQEEEKWSKQELPAVHAITDTRAGGQGGSPEGAQAHLGTDFRGVLRFVPQACLLTEACIKRRLKTLHTHSQPLLQHLCFIVDQYNYRV